MSRTKQLTQSTETDSAFFEITEGQLRIYQDRGEPLYFNQEEAIELADFILGGK